MSPGRVLGDLPPLLSYFNNQFSDFSKSKVKTVGGYDCCLNFELVYEQMKAYSSFNIE